MLILLTTLFLHKLHGSNIFFYLNAFIVLIVCCLTQLFISRHIVVGFNFVRDIIFFLYYSINVIMVCFSRTKLSMIICNFEADLILPVPFHYGSDLLLVCNLGGLFEKSCFLFFFSTGVCESPNISKSTVCIALVSSVDVEIPILSLQSFLYSSHIWALIRTGV